MTTETKKNTPAHSQPDSRKWQGDRSVTAFSRLPEGGLSRAERGDSLFFDFQPFKMSLIRGIAYLPELWTMRIRRAYRVTFAAVFAAGAADIRTLRSMIYSRPHSRGGQAENMESLSYRL